MREAGGGLRDDLRAVRVVWRRELLRFLRNRLRLVTSLVQPVLFLFVLGTGLSSLVALERRRRLQTFMFPGILAMTVLFTALFSAISIVWDREFGFLREMLVAPVRRGAIVVGKCAGGATTAAIQGCVMLAARRARPRPLLADAAAHAARRDGARSRSRSPRSACCSRAG